ncbi:MAG: hypothetical protein ACI83D_000459 [Planctomycetota bacterium]|jgi:hypothetical protein
MQHSEDMQAGATQIVSTTPKKKPWVMIALIVIVFIAGILFLKKDDSGMELLDIEQDLYQVELEELSLDSEINTIEYSDLGSTIDVAVPSSGATTTEVTATTEIEQELANTEALEDTLDSQLLELEALDF